TALIPRARPIAGRQAPASPVPLKKDQARRLFEGLLACGMPTDAANEFARMIEITLSSEMPNNAEVGAAMGLVRRHAERLHLALIALDEWTANLIELGAGKPGMVPR